MPEGLIGAHDKTPNTFPELNKKNIIEISKQDNKLLYANQKAQGDVQENKETNVQNKIAVKIEVANLLIDNNSVYKDLGKIVLAIKSAFDKYEESKKIK